MDFLIFIGIVAVVGFVLYKKVPKVKAAVDGVVGKLKGDSGA